MGREPRAYGVVGAGYGDEGKGLTTDYLAASNPGAVVVRSNGGAQAGHTVTTPDGRRHVFHHIGSGALAGNATHLSRFFVSNPMVYAAEAAEVSGKGGNVTVTADPRGAVTTPFDVMINQIVERTRGGGRHGSCGLGFGETLGRTEAGFALLVEDLGKGAGHIESILRGIRAEWVDARLSVLGVQEVTDQERALLTSDAILARFVEDCMAYAEAVPVRNDATLGSGDVIFEGAQGLMLDQDYGAFPHVTRSNTGAVNMAAVAREAGFRFIDVTYATRAYVTRHGAGPLAHEVPKLDFADVVDPTNEPNPWQGTIRYAPLDLDILRDAITFDIKKAARTGMGIRPMLAVSCLDQIKGEAEVVEAGAVRKVSSGRMADKVASSVGLTLALEGWGPTRRGVAAAFERAA